MSKCKVEPVTVDDLCASSLWYEIEAHAQENLGHALQINLDFYRHLESNGALALYGLFLENGRLVGVTIYIVGPASFTELKRKATEILVFVSKRYRKGRVGIGLIKDSIKLVRREHDIDIVRHCVPKWNRGLSKIYESLGLEFQEEAWELC